MIDLKEIFGVIENRSVPVNSVLPHISYRNLDAAVAWLTQAFGFSEYYRYGDPVGGVMMRCGTAYIMLKALREGARAHDSFLTVFTDDVEAHCARAKSAGAKIFEDLNETCYGEKQYGAADVEGHRWLFSEHMKDVNPADWGAKATDR